MDKSWLRQGQVNILRYLPEFLQSEKEFKATAESCSLEHERIRLLLQDIFSQFFIETATWGLDDWERVLAITTVKKDSFEQRRNRILLKLQSSQTSTVNYMIDLVKRYCTENTDINIEEYNEENRFRVVCKKGSVVYSNDLIKAIETYKPAHLAYRIALVKLLELKDDEKITYGLVNAAVGRKHIKPPIPSKAHFNIYSGVINCTAGRKFIEINKPAFFNALIYVGILKMKTGRVRIGGIK